MLMERVDLSLRALMETVKFIVKSTSEGLPYLLITVSVEYEGKP